MSIQVFVTQEELIVERTPQNLIHWVDQKLQEISQQEGGKEALRRRKGLCKYFMEEIYPIRILAEFQFAGRSDIKLQPVIGNQNYDALIKEYVSPSPHITKLEITQAYEGDEYLERLMLQEQGWSPLNGRINKRGTKNTGIEMEAEIVVTDVQDWLNNQITLIRHALEKKAKKNYESNTSLLIMFDDTIDLLVADAKEELQNFIQNELSRVNNFTTIYLAGRSKRIFIKWPLDIKK